MGIILRPWTPEDDADLTARYGIDSVFDLADRFCRTENAVKQRAINLGITRGRIYDTETNAEWDFDGDMMFIRAMARAIRAGLERPPRVGIDTRPCTKAPMPIEREARFAEVVA